MRSSFVILTTVFVLTVFITAGCAFRKLDLTVHDAALGKDAPVRDVLVSTNAQPTDEASTP